MNTLGTRIKNRREELEISQDELAKRMGYKSRSTVAKIESGDNDITQSKIMKFAEILETSPSYLMGWTESSSRSSAEMYKTLDNVTSIEKRQIPLIGTIAAGEPIFAEENIECYFEVGANIAADYALRVQGDSMINARILDGDIVFIRKQNTIKDGQIAAVLIDDEATLKRVYIEPEQVVLVAENPAYKPLIIKRDASKQVRILGIALAFQSIIN